MELAEKYFPQMIPESESADVLVRDIPMDSLKMVLEILEDLETKKDPDAPESDFLVGNILNLSPKYEKKILDLDLQMSIDLFHCSHFLDVYILVQLFTETIYKRFVQGKTSSDVLDLFRCFMPQITPRVIDVVDNYERRKRSKGLRFPEESDSAGGTIVANTAGICADLNADSFQKPTILLNDDEWVTLLASWDSTMSSALGQDGPQYLKDVIRRDGEMISSIRNTICRLELLTRREDQLSWLSTNFRKLVSNQQHRPPPNVLLQTYGDTYALLTKNPALVTKADVISIAEGLLDDAITAALSEARSHLSSPAPADGTPNVPPPAASADPPPPSSSAAAAVAAADCLRQAWRQVRDAAHRLGLVASYAARFPDLRSGPPATAPWERAALLASFQARAAPMLRSIAAALETPPAPGGPPAPVPVEAAVAAGTAAAEALRFVRGLLQPGAAATAGRGTAKRGAGEGVEIETYDRQVLRADARTLGGARVLADLLAALSPASPAAHAGGGAAAGGSGAGGVPRVRLPDKSCTARTVARVLEYLQRHAARRGGGGGGAVEDDMTKWDAEFAKMPDEVKFPAQPVALGLML